MLDAKKSAELMARVLCYLAPKDVAAAASTHKSWRGASHEPALWQAKAKDAFEHNPAPARAAGDARVDFEARYVDSRVLCKKLIAELAQPISLSANQLVARTAPLARDHRVEVAHYILKRTELRMQLRLSRSDVKAATLRAMSCVADADKPMVQKRGLEVEQAFERRVLKLRS